MRKGQRVTTNFVRAPTARAITDRLLTEGGPSRREATIAGAINTSAVRLPDSAARTAASVAETAPMEWPIKTTEDAFRVKASATSPPSMYLRRCDGLFVSPKPGWSCAMTEATLDCRESASNNSWKLSDVEPKPCDACTVTAPLPS